MLKAAWTAAAMAVLFLAPVLAGAQGALGVRTANLTAESAARLKLPGGEGLQGVEVVAVTPTGPADDAGIKVHDVILAVRGVNVVSVLQLDRLVAETPPGRPVPVWIERDGSRREVEVQLRVPLEPHSLGPPPGFSLPGVRPHRPSPMPSPMPPPMQAQAWGLEVAGLTPQLAAYFGLPPGQPGLLVRSVAPGSAASQAGLAAGDILIRWGGRPLARPSDVPPPTHGATLELFRRGKKQGVQIAPSGATL